MWQRLEGAKFEASLDFVAISYFKDKSEAVGLPRSYFNTEKAVLSNPQKRLEKLMPLLTPWTIQKQNRKRQSKSQKMPMIPLLECSKL